MIWTMETSEMDHTPRKFYGASKAPCLPGIWEKTTLFPCPTSTFLNGKPIFNSNQPWSGEKKMPLGFPNTERLTGGYPFEETPAGAFLSELRPLRRCPGKSGYRFFNTAWIEINVPNPVWELVSECVSLWAAFAESDFVPRRASQEFGEIAQVMEDAQM